MKTYFSAILTAGMFCVAMGASTALAEGGAETASSWSALAAGLAIGLGAFGAATAQGRAASAALEGIARNPNARSEVFMPLILALVFMELQALLAFVIAFLIKG